jgi:hypothetical protein
MSAMGTPFDVMGPPLDYDAGHRLANPDPLVRMRDQSGHVAPMAVFTC